MAGLGNYYMPAGLFSETQNRAPVFLAVLLHILVFILTLVPSSFFRPAVKMPEVVTIDLFNVEEFKTPKPVLKKEAVKRTRPKKVTPPKVLPPPPPSPKAVSIAEEPAPPPSVAAAPAKPISLRPRKMKKKITPKKKPKNRAFDAKLLNAVARIKAQNEQKMAEEKAQDRLAKLRDQLHTVKPAAASETAQISPVPPETKEPGPEGATAAGGDTVSASQQAEALKRYYLAVSRRIHEHWVLPEMQKWPDSLESIFVVVVNRNGVIVRRFFETKSGNQFFDQFVEKTIQAAEPMPHFPADLKDKSYEIGLVFHPSGLGL